MRYISLLSVLALLTACGGGSEAPPVTGGGDNPTSHQTVKTSDRDQLEEMRAQFARVDMTPDVSFLTEEERQVVNILIEIAHPISDIYKQQLSRENPTWAKEIGNGGFENADLVQDLYALHFSPWDSLDHNRPFYGDVERTEGAGFYPTDMTRDEFEAWIAANPDDEEAFRSPYTTIQRTADGLEAVPYSVAFKDELEKIEKGLREAASITTDDSLKAFLTLRADALSTDDYFESELAWMDLNGTIEVAMGPYEVYDDELFGYKTAWEIFVTVKDPEQSAALAKYKNYLRDMEANLPVPESYKNFKRGFESPIAVVTQVGSGGDATPGVQTVAFNLPNDERVREAKGAKKVLLSNVLDAKFDRILAPMADYVLVSEQASLLMQKYMSAEVLFHELAHSLGPGSIEKDGKQTSVSAELKELYTRIEEGKADVMGAYNILYMMERGELDVSEKENFLATYFVGLFRAMRFGINEAHGGGAAFQYTYLKEKGAFSVEDGKIRLDFAKLESAITDLTRDVVILQGNGDYSAASAFLTKYATLDAAADAIIESLTVLPVDIQPIYPEKI